MNPSAARRGVRSAGPNPGDPGQPRRSYIEAHFNVQRRMADWDFSQAQTWSGLKDAHKKWMTDYRITAYLAMRSLFLYRTARVGLSV